VAELSPDKIVVGAIGAAIGAAIGSLLPGGLTSAITVLLTSAGSIVGLIFSLMYKRYVGILAASAHDKNTTDRNARAERQAYDELRKGLRGDNIAARLYADWLTKFLDAVDRFFGDAGMADRTLFPCAFGLKTPASLWTAPAFDRCLMLALIYPIATIFLIWAIGAHMSAQTGFGLLDKAPVWYRLFGAVTVLGQFALFWKARRSESWIGFLWRFVCGVCLGIIGFNFVGVLAFFGAVAVAKEGVAAFTFAFVFTIGLIAGGVVIGRGASDGTFIAADVLAFGLALAAARAVGFIAELAVSRSRQGLFQSVLTILMISACLVATYTSSPFWNWTLLGPLLAFLCLLTLINAPFDWASLGLTRALLRRGLERGGWWPYVLAFVDALAAAFIIALLAITMVIAVQTFDHLAEHSGGPTARVLPLEKLFDGMAAQPSAPEYWWVYALLLSTMIPSLLNLMIGGVSLLRGIPGLPALLLRFMPASKAVPLFNRELLALALTCQLFIGAFLGLLAQFVLAIGVIFYVLPWMGLELLDTARAVAEFDLPGRVLGVWWGNH
jgi:hypothetical protein